MKKPTIVQYTLCVFVSLGLASCGGGGKPSYSQQEEPLYTIDLDAAEIVKRVEASDFFTKAEVITLEETDGSLLARIDKIYAKGDTLFVMDSRTKTMLAFNGNGSFLFKVGNVGRGPGEYNSISDFTVDSQNGHICVLDPNAGTIDRYRLSDGKFVNEVVIEGSDNVRANYIHYFDGGIYTDTYFSEKPKDNYLIRRLDAESGMETDGWLSQDAYNLGWNEMYYTGRSPFVYGNDSLFRFVQLFMSQIVTVTDKGVQPFIGIKSKDLITANDFNATGRSGANDKYRSLSSSGKIYSIHDYVEFENNIWFSYYRGVNMENVFYRKDTNDARIVYMLADDLTYVPETTKSCSVSYVDEANKMAYSVVDARKLYADYKAGFVSENLGGAKQLETLSDGSNPVIIRYRYE